MPIQIKDIDHIVLRVTDVDRAIQFYCEVLGCTMERARPEIGLYHLRAGRVLIDLVDIKEKPEPSTAINMDHFALQIEPFNETEIRSHLAAHNITASNTSQNYGAQGIGPSLNIEDPDGNVVELKGPPGLGV